MSCCFKEELGKDLEIMYEGDGTKIARDFYIPVLKRSTFYRRVSGYFSIDSLVVTATGVAGLIKNGGKMQLILGAHELGPEWIDAYRMSRTKAEQLLMDIGSRIASGLERIEDILSIKRVEALAWMLTNGLLEVKVAMPKKTFLGLGNGIFHEKVLIFDDCDQCRVGASGSANETLMSYTLNGENLTVHMSWKLGHEEYITRYTDRFNALWQDRHPDYYVFPLPRAIEEKLKEKFYPSFQPELDPLEDKAVLSQTGYLDTEKGNRLVPLARLIKVLGKVGGFSHLGLGPVRLYPHQVFAVDFALSKFPHRILLADEVGLGKTLEAGAIVKRLVDSGFVKRILILTPKNVSKQWLDELWFHFGLRFWLFDPLSRMFKAADGSTFELRSNNPYAEEGIDLVISSWYFARGSRRKPSLLQQTTRFFDLVVIDEAHNARKRRNLDRTVPTRLNELCRWLSVTTPNMILLTATPVQLNSLEALDLLEILGLGGGWVLEHNFEMYYNVIASDSPEYSDSLSAFTLASWFAKNYLTSSQVEEVLKTIIADPDKSFEVKQAILLNVNVERVVRNLFTSEIYTLKSILTAFSPIQWFMIRNTREKLVQMDYRFPEREVEEEAVQLDDEHRSLLEDLDDYLRLHYDRYMKAIAPENRGIMGFVTSVYHQRFVSSFTAAYETIKSRKLFLQALLDGDEDAMLKAARKILADEELIDESDEEDVVSEMRELLSPLVNDINEELSVLKDLEERLSPYNSNMITANDPKMRKVVEVVDEAIRKGHRVLVFSKYTDTVDAIRSYMATLSDQLTKSDIGVYTGEGGLLYNIEKGEYEYVSKEKVSRELENGRIRVLVCSDAASEGLNLQAASVVVNVDMPWNPAKVEQRIGRSDRLGQKSAKVFVKNVWYPGTIEAEMYRVLFERKELYNLVVGPAQEIISDAMRKAIDVGARGERLKNLIKETIDKVNSSKERRIMTDLSGRSLHHPYPDDQPVIERVVAFVLKAAEALGMKAKLDNGVLSIMNDLPQEIAAWNDAKLDAGRVNSLTIAHPLVQYLADLILDKFTGGVFDKSIYSITEYDGLSHLYIVEQDYSAPREAQRSDVISIMDEMLKV